MAPIATLTVRISAQIAELQKSFADANKTTQEFANNFEGIATRAASVGTFLGTIAANIASSFARGFASVIKDAVRLSQEFSNAFIGLSSVARAFGATAAEATAAARKLSSDGLLPLKDSATGLKNLLAAGFNLDQSTKLMNAFKDSAAFGRQSALSFGDAVRSATEGVKNGNSILVDNAGVTKNLSVILKEAGFTMQDLADKTDGAAARQALLNGILRETVAQQGDAARIADTYTGQLTAMHTAWDNLKATWGNAITQNKTVALALKGVGEMFQWLSARLSDNQSGFNLVSDAVILFVKALASVVGMIDLVQKAFALLQVGTNTTFEAIAAAGILLFKFQERAAKVMKYLDPINFERHARAVDEARDTYTFLEGAVTGFQQASAAAMDRSARWGTVLQGVRENVETLAKKLEETRGQTVKVGETAGQVAPPIADLADKTDKAGKAADKANLAFAKWSREMTAAWAAVKELADDAMWNRIHEHNRLLNLGLHQSTEAAAQMIRDWKFGTEARPLIPTMEPFTLSEYRGELERQGDAAAHAYGKPFREVFTEIGQQLPDLLFGLLSGQVGMVEGIAGTLGNAFASVFQHRVDLAAQAGRGLTGAEKAIGVAGIGLESFIGGFNIGKATGTKTKGALGGAASGALQGAIAGSVVPGIGTAIGAVVGGAAGLFGGLFGASSAQKKMKAELAANKKALLEQYGGMEKLRALADKLGVNIQKAFDAKKPEQFEAAVNSLNKAIEEHNKRLEALGKAVEGVNKRTAIFAKQFEAAFKAGDTAKLAEIAERTQPEFERLGFIVRDTFAALIKESGNGIDAMLQMEPAFKVLQQGVDDFGLTSTAVIDELLANFRLVTDEGLKPFFDAIVANGQVLRGLFDAKALSPEGFQAIAADIGQSIQEIVNRGGDMARTLALSQPILQTLWEAQQQYGAVTDQTTQSILTQAEQQGLVGAHMKEVNEKILDVLLAIGKVLGADIPAYFDRLKQPADDAAANIEQAFTDITIPPVEIPYVYVGENAPPGANVPALASGGIVRRPTLALIGEGGPEAVIPLTGGSLGVEGTYITDVYLDGERIARSTAKRMPRVLRTMGVGM